MSAVPCYRTSSPRQGARKQLFLRKKCSQDVSDQIDVCRLVRWHPFYRNICDGGQVEGRLGRTQSERNDTNRHRRALKSLKIHGDPSLREQGVGSSNLPAPTNDFNKLQKERNIGAMFCARKRDLFAWLLGSTRTQPSW